MTIPLLSKKQEKGKVKKQTQLTIDSGLQGKVFLVITLLSFMGIILLMKPFLSAIIIGIIAALIAYPLYNYFGKKTKYGQAVRTLLVSLIFLLLIIIPIVILVISIVNEAPQFIAMVEEDVDVDVIEELIDSVHVSLENQNLSGPLAELLEQALDSIGSVIATIVSSFGQFLTSLIAGFVTSLIPFFTNLIIFIFIFVTILPNLDNIFKSLEKVSPFDKDITDLFIGRISITTRNMILASITISLISGLIVGIMYLIFGLPFIGIVTMLAIVFGFIPLVGPSFVTIPTAIILAINGQWGPAIIFILVQIFVIGQVDLFVRPRFQDEDTKVNAVVMGIAVMGGIATFGVLGVIYGPLIVIIFMTCIQIYMENYGKTEEPADKRKTS